MNVYKRESIALHGLQKSSVGIKIDWEQELKLKGYVLHNKVVSFWVFGKHLRIYAS